ncbi:hypothetical protein G3Q17_001430 [Shigella flexneri]|nr:hypothetical protein [Shigella flexneri]EFP9233315.1 hypothetical protein [Shigella flexneri]EFP9425756.1 hypothetical protein [Shigella flexneri]
MLEILTYYVYAPVSPRCPCPNCLQQLRLLNQVLIPFLTSKSPNGI